MLAFATAAFTLFKQLASYVFAHPVRFIILALVIALGVTYCQNQRLEHQVVEAKTEAKDANQAASTAKATTDFVTTDAHVKEQVNLDATQKTQANNQSFDQIDAELKAKLIALDKGFEQAERDRHAAADVEVKSPKQPVAKPPKNPSRQPQTSTAPPPPAVKTPVAATADLNTQKAAVIIDSLWATYNVAAKAGHP